MTRCRAIGSAGHKGFHPGGLSGNRRELQLEFHLLQPLPGPFDESVIHGKRHQKCPQSISLVRLGKLPIKKFHPVLPSKPSGFPVPRRDDGGPQGQFRLGMGSGQCSRCLDKEGDYYQGKKSIPRPLQLIRHAGSGPLELTAHDALALTKMDWNNDALYDPVPVSIRYSQKMARTIANVPDLPRNVYPYRLFM